MRDASLPNDEETRSRFNFHEDQALTVGSGSLGEAKRFQGARTARIRSSKTGVGVMSRNSLCEFMTEGTVRLRSDSSARSADLQKMVICGGV